MNTLSLRSLIPTKFLQALALMLAISLLSVPIISLPTPAAADEPTPITECGAITEPGEYVLTGNLATTTAHCLTIQAASVSIDGGGFTITGTTTGGFYGISVNGNDATNGFRLTDVSVHDFEIGIYVGNTESADVEIDNVTITWENEDSALYAGIDIEHATGGNVLVSSSTITGTATGDGSGILVETGENITLTNNTIADLEDGIYVNDLSGTNVIADNEITTPFYTGISANGIENTTISGNTVSSPENDGQSYNGIYIYEASSTIISSNILYSEYNSATGIDVTNAYETEITDNTTTGFYEGIELWEMDGLLVSGNTIIGSYDSGIWLDEGEDVTIDDNIIQGPLECSYACAAIYVADSVDVTISSNEATEASVDGILVSYSENVTIAGNDVEVGVDGMDLENNTVSLVVSDNTVVAGENGIVIEAAEDEEATYQVTGNDITAGEVALSLFYSLNVEVLGNTFRADTWVYNPGEYAETNTFSGDDSGNTYYLADGTPAWEVYDIFDTDGDGWADTGFDLPFNNELAGEATSGLGEIVDWYSDGEWGDDFEVWFDGESSTGTFLSEGDGSAFLEFELTGEADSAVLSLQTNDGNLELDIPAACLQYDDEDNETQIDFRIYADFDDSTILVDCYDEYLTEDWLNISEGIITGITSIDEVSVSYDTSVKSWRGGGFDAHPRSLAEGESAPQPQPSRSTTSGGRSGGTVNSTISSNSNNATLIQQVINEIRARVQKMIVDGQPISPAIQAFLNSLSPTTPNTVRDLEYGMEGTDVTALQHLLINQGHPIPAGATGFFLDQTRAALSAYQAANNIAPSVGYFGGVTRAVMKAAGLTGLWW